MAFILLLPQEPTLQREPFEYSFSILTQNVSAISSIFIGPWSNQFEHGPIKMLKIAVPKAERKMSEFIATII